MCSTSAERRQSLARRFIPLQVLRLDLDGAVSLAMQLLSQRLSRASARLDERDLSHVGDRSINHELVEAVVRAGVKRRDPPLAVYLHHPDERTTDGLKARANPEPDSKGGVSV
jgi:hypothetical protein